MTQPAPAPSRGARLLRDRRLWIAVAVVAVLLGLRATGLGDILSLETLRTHRAWLSGLVAEHRLVAALLYTLVYVVVVALSIPGAVILTLAGGFLFGALLGTLLAVVGATIGAVLVFLLARAVFGPDALDRFGPRAAGLAEGIRRNAWSYLLVLRLVPLFPFFLVNLVPPFVGVRLPVYALTTCLGILPGTAVFSLSGAGLGSVLDAGGSLDLGSILTPQIIGALLGLAALSLLAIPLKARFAR
ncbi:putative membrane protein YdjX (TVP38/TMEM64 family) [Humitalea rosea]|uniref:TVP38/TMEM64 family membrane protein n=1 Tax=Humitalea rosea TaxID=990373 RepID=A0A2W7IBW1_9PROT|nr:TVP38/TMEM64 family protein [Humitalea rosea]PZW43042.1 putative membrane protein YdjX (TVP38/TMEM64 family) [Humitalea rosea]